MNWLQWAVIAFCGFLIGLALILFLRTIKKMLKGRCCEGCDGCPQASTCSSKQPPEPKQ